MGHSLCFACTLAGRAEEEPGAAGRAEEEPGAVKHVEPHANFKAIWAPYLRYLERPNTGQNQIYPGSAIGGLYFTSDIHRPCLRSSPKVTLDMEIDAAGVKILLVELSTLLI